MTCPEAGPLGKAAIEQLNQGELPRLPAFSKITCSTGRAKLASPHGGDVFRRRAAALPGLISGLISQARLCGVDVNHLLQPRQTARAPAFLHPTLPCAERPAKALRANGVRASAPSSCRERTPGAVEVSAPGARGPRLLSAPIHFELLKAETRACGWRCTPPPGNAVARRLCRSPAMPSPSSHPSPVQADAPMICTVLCTPLCTHCSPNSLRTGPQAQRSLTPKIFLLTESP